MPKTDLSKPIMFSVGRELDLESFITEATQMMMTQGKDMMMKENKESLSCICRNCEYQIVYSKTLSKITKVSTKHECTDTDTQKFKLPKLFINMCVLKSYIHGNLGKNGVKKIINEVLTTVYEFSPEEDMCISNSIRSLKKELMIDVTDGWRYIESFLARYEEDNGKDLVFIEYSDSRITRIAIKAPYYNALTCLENNLLFMDGCFISAAYGGCLLILITISPEKSIIPISMCYCSSESKENTLFFLEKNKEGGIFILLKHFWLIVNTNIQKRDYL